MNLTNNTTLIILAAAATVLFLTLAGIAFVDHQYLQVLVDDIQYGLSAIAGTIGLGHLAKNYQHPKQDNNATSSIQP